MTSKLNCDDYFRDGSKYGKYYDERDEKKSFTITMLTTIYLDFESESGIENNLILDQINLVVRQMQTYVPGVRLLMRPVITTNRVTITLQVKGNGDYLPSYSGNLDIINAAAIQALFELFARDNEVFH